MHFSDPPDSAAWAHHDAREGFEVTFFHRLPTGWRLEGTTTAVEQGQSWSVSYDIVLDDSWRTRRAHVTSQTGAGGYSVSVQQVEPGSWLVNDTPAPHLDGCQDVDLEASAMTNALPVHRLGLDVGEHAGPPAAFVRVIDGDAERLEQTYQRIAGEAPGQVYAYEAPAFDVGCHLAYDESGLVLSYPGLATRHR